MVIRPADLRTRLHGVIAFPVTPFAADRSLDRPTLRANLRRLLAHPVCAVVAAGGTGELYSLTPAEHLEIVRITIEEAAGRVPVIAGTGFNAALAVQLAAAAAAAGASGILAFPPYYPNADEEGLYEYYRAIGGATDLGLLIYSRDWFNPGPGMVARLAGIPALVAWKDGQGDMRRLQALRGEIGDRLAWIGGAGDDLVAAYYSLGIRAFTSSIANVSPRLALDLHDAASGGDSNTLQRISADYIVPLYALRARRRGYEVTVMKELMNLLGLGGGFVRPPLPSLHADDLAVLRALAPRWRELIEPRVPRSRPSRTSRGRRLRSR